jgi:hypothetical protein
MAKKDFRPVSQTPPRHPKPSELTQSSLRKLGFAALGGFLLGGAPEIPRAHAEGTKSEDSAKTTRARPHQGGAKKGKPAKDVDDAKGPPRTPRFMPNGGKPAPRWVEVGDVPAPARNGDKPPPKRPGQPPQGSKKDGAATGTNTSADPVPVPPPRLGGEPPAARMPEDEKAAPARKGEGTAGKTDTKKQPEFLPPPGAPPMPRNPEPVPAPKKSK